MRQADDTAQRVCITPAHSFTASHGGVAHGQIRPVPKERVQAMPHGSQRPTSSAVLAAR